MPALCCVTNCHARKDRTPYLKFFSIPVDPDRRKLWLSRINRNFKLSVHTRICSLHFIEGKPSKDPQHPDFAPSRKLGHDQLVKTELKIHEGYPSKDPLHRDYYPSFETPPPTTISSTCPIRQRRFDRNNGLLNRTIKLESSEKAMQTQPVIRGYFVERGMQTDFSMETFDGLVKDIHDAMDTIKHLQKELETLKQETSNSAEIRSDEKSETGTKRVCEGCLSLSSNEIMKKE